MTNVSMVRVRLLEYMIARVDTYDDVESNEVHSSTVPNLKNNVVHHSIPVVHHQQLPKQATEQTVKLTQNKHVINAYGRLKLSN